MSDISEAHRNALIRWQLADAKMRHAVADELEARNALTKLYFTNPTEGTNNFDLPDGSVLKAKFVNYYNLDKNVLAVQTVQKSLPRPIRDALIKWKPEISVSQYKALEPTYKRLVNEILTISPGRPSFEVVEKKTR